MELSIVIPAYNEEESLPELTAQIESVMEREGLDYEIIFINDGSRDGTLDVMKDLARKNERVRVYSYPVNRGKSLALSVGFHYALGEVAVTMDADLQDNPGNIPDFLKKIREGYDLVNGWKKDRNDSWDRILLSRVFNILAAKLCRSVRIHDMNCGFKAYKKKAYKNVRLRGDLHRLIPAILMAQGFKATEIPVVHKRRKYGKSRYRALRYRGLLDLLTLNFVYSYEGRPIYYYGFRGALILFFGTALSGWAALRALLMREADSTTVALLVAGCSSLTIGFVFFAMGMISETIAQMAYSDMNRVMIENSVDVFSKTGED